MSETLPWRQPVQIVRCSNCGSIYAFGAQFEAHACQWSSKGLPACYIDKGCYRRAIDSGDYLTGQHANHDPGHLCWRLGWRGPQHYPDCPFWSDTDMAPK